VLAYTPPWARGPDCSTEKCRPVDPAAFAAFGAEAAKRYSPRGVHAWEIWNEPNGTGFWAPRPSAHRYNELLTLTAAAIKRADPRSTIILGGLAALPNRDGNIAATTFLAQLGRLNAIQRVDAVGYHPYTYPYLASFQAPWRTPWNMIHSTNPRGLRSVLRQYQRPDLPIWLTEYGAPTHGPGTPSDGSPSSITKHTTHVTEQRQAQIAADAVKAAAQDRAIGALIWYSDRDLGQAVSGNEGFYGLRRSGGSRKPAFEELRRAVTGVRAARPPG
jgi:polysaccharide biosynthesis protein PslG